jgi:hypothetical protein
VKVERGREDKRDVKIEDESKVGGDQTFSLAKSSQTEQFKHPLTVPSM